jgi:hypothetical protein
MEGDDSQTAVVGGGQMRSSIGPPTVASGSLPTHHYAVSEP